ncbi:MAG: hypothetical protein ACLSDQ_10620 [Adlercreutzia equolifaciens]
MVLKVYAEDPLDLENPEAHGGIFGLGNPNDAYAQYFTGQSYLNPLTDPEKTHHRQRHLRAGLPQQLAHPPRGRRRRPNSARHRRRGLVPGVGTARPQDRRG